MASYELPILYTTDKKGKTRMWEIFAVGNTVYKEYGELDGKRIKSERKFGGMNIGRKNETTPEQQARLEAERAWLKQLDKDYFPRDKKGIELAKKLTKTKAEQGGLNRDVFSRKTLKAIKKDGTVPGYESKFYPMLCQEWSFQPKVLKYFEKENYVQPKLDGVRAFAKIVQSADGPQVVFTSRKGKQFPWLNHLREELLDVLENYENVILDCEIYANYIYGKTELKGKKLNYVPSNDIIEPDQRFNVITSVVKPGRKEPHPLESQMCLHVFDIADESGEMSQKERFDLLDTIFENVSEDSHIIKVETRLAPLDDIEKLHEEFSEKGYEGIIIRSPSLVYENGARSLKLRKYKYTEDAEYTIFGVECDPGVDIEHFTWLCSATEDGEKMFSVKPMGTREQKYVWYENCEDYVGKLLTVKYQEISRDGIPRFPRGVAIRDYE